MQLAAAIANTLWTGANLPAYWRFRRALSQPHIVQRQILRHLLQSNASTAFGKAHAFDKIRAYDEFTRAVPLSDYRSLEPWIARIQRGEPGVLTSQPISRLVPTSGSTGPRKLIPFTSALQRQFNSAIAAWMVDLQNHSPGLLGGRAYWSITPVLRDECSEDSAVPIGFDADTSYL